MSHENRMSLFGPLQSLWIRFKAQIVKEVPLEDARCEFDCRKPHCSHGEWENCEGRKKTAELEKASRNSVLRT